MTPDIQSIRERLEKATNGPWHVVKDSEGDVCAVNANERTGCDEEDEPFHTVCRMPVEKYGYGCAWASAENADLIANCPTDIALLLRRIEEMGAVVEAARALRKMLDEDIGMDKTELTLLRSALAALDKREGT